LFWLKEGSILSRTLLYHILCYWTQAWNQSKLKQGILFM
jgi:hypothetical protein